MPKGEEQSHGTARTQYPRTEPGDDLLRSEARENMPDWLWNAFTTYDHIAPGRADGTFGQETIG